MLSNGMKISGYNEENFTIEGIEKSTFLVLQMMSPLEC